MCFKDFIVKPYQKGTWKYDLNPHKYDYDLGFWIKLTDAAAAFCEKTSAGLNQII